ncbi:MAG TPA: alanine racemase [Saprospiraceae bacterium]|nr:alanine racemase [Saprospiraceae bacterium]
MKLLRRDFLKLSSNLSMGCIMPFIDMRPANIHSYASGRVLKDNRFDPWLEISANSLQNNVNALSSLADGRPVIAVVKNNAYGLGLEYVPSLLEKNEKVIGFGVVKADECFRLISQSINKPVLLLARASYYEEVELIREGIELCVFSTDDLSRLSEHAKRIHRNIKIHAYIDTGMNRVGMPYFKAFHWLKSLVNHPNIQIVSTFTDLTEDPEFDIEQAKRLQSLCDELRSEGIDPGYQHAASSNGIYHVGEAHLDVVRPGISMYGAYPTHFKEEQTKMELQVAYKWCARVVRVEKMRKGDTVSYGRNFKADPPTWIATLPVGHSDGYPRKAIEGAKILIGEKIYPVIGAVSASHCIVNLGSDTNVRTGDIAILVGPDHPEILPNEVSNLAGISVYDLLMHMNPTIPKVVYLGSPTSDK